MDDNFPIEDESTESFFYSAFPNCDSSRKLGLFDLLSNCKNSWK
jgi:hypothetical protein